MLLPIRHYHPVFVERCVASVLGQTSPRWRLLVVDDGADERLRDILATALCDPRVRLSQSEGRRLAGAINTGTRQAETKYVAIVLGDDMWSRDAVEVLTRNIEDHPGIDCFHSSRRVIDERDAAISGVYEARASFALKDFVNGSPVKHLLCWRRELALELGGLDESLLVAPDDYDFPWTMAERGATFMAIPECLYLFRDHRESFRMTTHMPRSVHVRGRRRIMRKHGVGLLRRERSILEARRSYMRQSLFRNRLHRWLKERVGYDARRGWRQPRP